MGVVVEVAAQLLIAPPLKHLPHRLRLSVQRDRQLSATPHPLPGQDGGAG